jgi:hypothetical protein
MTPNASLNDPTPHYVTPTENATITFIEGSRLQIILTNSTYFKMIAEVPQNHYLAIGFGSNMTNSDMIIW